MSEPTKLHVRICSITTLNVVEFPSFEDEPTHDVQLNVSTQDWFGTSNCYFKVWKRTPDDSSYFDTFIPFLEKWGKDTKKLLGQSVNIKLDTRFKVSGSYTRYTTLYPNYGENRLHLDITYVETTTSHLFDEKYWQKEAQMLQLFHTIMKNNNGITSLSECLPLMIHEKIEPDSIKHTGGFVSRAQRMPQRRTQKRVVKVV